MRSELDAALEARDTFLEKHPEMITYQMEISRRLLKADSPDDRLRIIIEMLADNLLKLDVETKKIKDLGAYNVTKN